MGVLSILDREDLKVIYELVMEEYKDKLPEGFDKMLWGDLMIMFNQGDAADFWDTQQNWKLISWKLHSSSGVHTIMTSTGLVIHMFVENRYPLTKEVLSNMLELKLETEEESSMALELIKFVKQQLEELYRTISRLRLIKILLRRTYKTSDELAAIQAQLNNLGREIKKVEGYKATALGYYQRNNANPSFQERSQSMEDTLSKIMSESAKRQEEDSILIKQIRASTDAAIRNQGALIKTLEIQIEKMSKNRYLCFNNKSRQTTVPFPSRLDNHYCEEEGNYGPKFTEAYGASHINNAIPRKEKDPGSFTLPCFINDFCFDNALVDLGASVSVMPLSTYLNLGLGELAHTRLTVELADRTVKYPKGIAENVLVGIGKFTFPIDFIILDMPEDVKVPLILGRPFLSTARAKIDVYKRKITLRVGEEKIIFKSVKPASSIIKRVYMLSLRERMELDLEARLMGETLVLNRSLDPFSEDYIELNDLNEPFELRRNQGDDLMPTIEEGEVIEEFRTRDEDLDTGIDDYPSYCDDDKKIHIDCAHNLKFSCMIGFEFTHANFFPLLYVNMMSRKFHNSIMKNKMVYKGNNVVGALMNVPIFVGTFSVMTDFAVLEDMDAYRDNEMGDVIFGEPFLREVGIKTKRFEGIITLYNGNNEVTYQMVSKKDEINGISHAYQKLKGFYKEVLNLGPDFIRVLSMEEWLTCGHISVHEVLYKVEDIATYLVEYVKFWDDWGVDRYGNANLDYYSEDQYTVSIKKIRRIRACTHQRPQKIKEQYADKEEQIKKAEEEARLNAISKPEVIKVVREEAKKLGIHPKEQSLPKLVNCLRKIKMLNMRSSKNNTLRRYERLRQIPRELGIQSALPTPKQTPSQVSRRKCKHMELEPETRIPRLECNRALPKNVLFVNNMVIEEPEYGIFFTDEFGDQAF
ncbi:putative reverse transcriptase domain-containing protein [Tanacetum coccineum]